MQLKGWVHTFSAADSWCTIQKERKLLPCLRIFVPDLAATAKGKEGMRVIGRKTDVELLSAQVSLT
jgi:hypothetical protein